MSNGIVMVLADIILLLYNVLLCNLDLIILLHHVYHFIKDIILKAISVKSAFSHQFLQ